MALTAGSVSFAVSGSTMTASGTGLALAIGNVHIALLPSGMSSAAKVAWGNSVSTYCNALATAIVDHITANGFARVTTQQVGRTTTAGNAIDAPSSPVNIPII